MAEPKTKKTTASVEAFVESIENDQRRSDAKQLLKIHKEVTRMMPAMWGPSIIGYGVYHYKAPSATAVSDWPRMGFSPRKAYLTIYILPGFAKYAPLLKRLGKHRVSKSCLYINKLSDIHIPTLRMMLNETLKEMDRRYPRTPR